MDPRAKVIHVEPSELPAPQLLLWRGVGSQGDAEQRAGSMCDVMQGRPAEKRPHVQLPLSGGVSLISQTCFSFKTTDLHLGLKNL